MPRINNKPTIAVLMGGINSEREVSLETGRLVLEALNTLDYEAEPVVYEGDLPGAVDALQDFDLVFNALHGGDGEDGTIQSALSRARIRYTGSRSQASQLAMDKHACKQLMTEAGIPTAPWVFLMLDESKPLPRNEDYPDLTEFLGVYGYPAVVKPNHEGSTVGLSIVESPDDLDEAMLVAREFGTQVIVEKYIPGRELTVAILDGRPLPIVEIIPRHHTYDYECKYTDGMSTYVVPAELPLAVTASIQDAARQLYESLRCRHYARIDFRLNPEGEFFCLELNTLPGMTSHSLVPMAAKAVEINFVELIDRIVNLAMATQEPK